MKFKLTYIITVLLLVGVLLNTMTGCSNGGDSTTTTPPNLADPDAPYTLQEIDGYYYLNFADGNEYESEHDDMCAFPTDWAWVTFRSFEELKSDLFENGLTESEMITLKRYFKKDKNGIQLCRTDVLSLQPQVPENWKLTKIDLCATGFHKITLQSTEVYLTDISATFMICHGSQMNTPSFTYQFQEFPNCDSIFSGETRGSETIHTYTSGGKIFQTVRYQTQSRFHPLMVIKAYELEEGEDGSMTPKSVPRTVDLHFYSKNYYVKVRFSQAFLNM